MPFQIGNKGFRDKESYIQGGKKISNSRQQRKKELGYINSPQTRKRMSEALMGRIPWNKGKKITQTINEKNGLWKRDLAGEVALHTWVRARLEKTNCVLKDDTCKGRLELSNKSGEYKRDIIDWWYLCSSHHKRYDRDNIPGALYKVFDKKGYRLTQT